MGCPPEGWRQCITRSSDVRRSVLVISNARVWTGSQRRPWASAVAISGERIRGVGSAAEIIKQAERGAEVIDVAGAMVLPGFIDAHVHLVPSAQRLSSVQLRDVDSAGEFRRRIEAFARTVPAGSWITGGDWDHQRWGGELPTRSWIDAISGDHPVFVSRHDGHMALANSAALRAAGIDAGTADVAGGSIVRDPSGVPTGVLKDEAMRPVLKRIPPPSRDEAIASIAAACAYLAERGVTSIHHMGTWEDVELLRAAREAGALRTRIYAAVPMSSWRRLADEIGAAGRGDQWLLLGGLKAFMDGSLGSHTAAFIEPYADAPGDYGLFVTEPDRLRADLRGARAHDLQPIIHAIGDRAVRTVLDLYEEEWRGVDASLPRPRIEHAQHVRPDDVPRFAALNVMASVQPYHLADDGRWAAGVIGSEREAEAFPIGSLLRSGAAVVFGSDWFVAPPEPLEAITAAVTRRTLDGAHPDGWTPAERITAEEALRAHTVTAACAEWPVVEKGLVQRGALADLTVVDRDLTTLAPEELSSARILLTMVGGEIVYDARVQGPPAHSGGKDVKQEEP